MTAKKPISNAWRLRDRIAKISADILVIHAAKHPTKIEILNKAFDLLQAVENFDKSTEEEIIQNIYLAEQEIKKLEK